MPFDHYMGACGVFTFDQPKILVCLTSTSPYQDCKTLVSSKTYFWLNNLFSFDGSFWSDFQSTSYPHHYILDIGSYRGKPIVTGSESPAGLKTEIYDHSSQIWVESTDYAWST